ncbi:MAG: polysaccharide biosynthesis/export family protein [Candidatus Acidiferrales bacterium]
MFKSNILRISFGSVLLLCWPSSQGTVAQEKPNAEDSQNYRSPSYRIHIGDVLQVSVSKHPELSRKIAVRGDANHILLERGGTPRASAMDDAIRDMQVAGLTALNVATALREKLKPMIADPQVTISVVDTIMKPGPPSDKPSPQLRDTPPPAQKQSSGRA